MSKVRIRIYPGGAAKAIYGPGVDLAALGFAVPQRASHVEPIASGPRAGWWYVDLSPLGERENDPALLSCLWPPHPPTCREAALAAEVAFLTAHWMSQPPKPKES